LGPPSAASVGPGRPVLTRAEHPKARYPVTPSARLMIGQRKLTPDRLWELAMRTQFPTPKP
jgi:hypothetical protein